MASSQIFFNDLQCINTPGEPSQPFCNASGSRSDLFPTTKTSTSWRCFWRFRGDERDDELIQVIGVAVAHHPKSRFDQYHPTEQRDEQYPAMDQQRDRCHYQVVKPKLDTLRLDP